MNSSLRGPTHSAIQAGRRPRVVEHSGSAEAHQWTIDEPLIQKMLFRIVARVARGISAREELMQEALLHFWLQTERRPGQRLSWYLQSCQFHLQHLQAAGRSVDSSRRRLAQVRFDQPGEDRDCQPGASELDEGIMSEINARDLVALLSEQLKPIDRTILGWLADGFGTRDIASRFQISRQAVN